MKIIMPIDSREEDRKINPTLARAGYFLVRDMDSKEMEILENPAIKASGGAGIKAAQFIVSTGADVLLAARAGKNAMEILDEAGVEAYKTMADSPEDNIKMFLSGRLDRLTESESVK